MRDVQRAFPGLTDERELRAAGIGAGVLLIYASLVLASDKVELIQFAKLFSAYLAGSVALWSVVGTVCFFAAVFVRARASKDKPFLIAMIREGIVERWQRDRGIPLIWPPLMFALLIAAFNSFKQMVLPLAGFQLDHVFAAADRMLFLGSDGWVVTHSIFGGPAATVAIDRIYHTWFLPMALGVIVCAWLPRSMYKLRTQYLLSYIGIWIVLGTILAFLLSSAGPCFHTPLVGPAPEFDALMARLHEVEANTGTPLLALKSQEVLLAAHFSDRLALGGGISAMPSVHNALAVLFALAGWRVSRTLGWLFTAYAAAIWIGSIHLGWHYAVDGIVAAGLTLGIWFLCGRLAERLERPLVQPAVEPALI